jgi:ankyrin repeat protein
MELSIVNRGARDASREISLCVLCILCVLHGVVLSGPVALAQTPDDKADALSDAARKGDVAAVKKLLDEGVNVDTKFRYNRTALSFAADRGHAEVVKLLLDRGADINAKDTFYNATALTWAVTPALERTPKHTEVVRVLLAHGGIPPEALSNALKAATQAKLEDVAALLQKAGAK